MLVNVGHHAFVHAANSPRSGGPDSRPTSRGRNASPAPGAGFGQNMLRTSTPPGISSRDGSPRPPSRKAPVPSALPLGMLHGDLSRGRPPPNPAFNNLDDPMSPLPLPPTIPGARGSDRSSSRDRPSSRGSATGGSRPGTPGSPGSAGLRPGTPGDDQKTKRKSFFSSGGKLQKKNAGSHGTSNPSMEAFVKKPSGKNDPYDLTPILKAQPVPELWDQSGNMFVHLYPNSTPSFRLDSSIIAASRGLQKLIQGGSRRSSNMSPTSHMRHLSLGDALSPTGARSARSSSVSSADRPWSPSQDDEPAEIHIQIPLMVDRNDPSSDEVTRILSVRNLFAFLIGQLVVSNHQMPTMFATFERIAEMLTEYQFSNFDGSTMGEAAEAAFLGYIADLRLDDVRKSREKTMEAIILGERMKCWPLYNEAYVHGVGKWEDLRQMNSPLFTMISARTRSAMEKSAMDLAGRLRVLREHLDDFNWPGLFAGFLNSKSIKQSVDVDSWKNSWVGLRKHVLNHYKKQYGNWPPKAKSKKNDFEGSGLNRTLLQAVFKDFTDVYDLLVSREELTERTVDSSHGDTLSEDINKDTLRKLLSEFDRSLAPVRPPIPYDLPKLPTFGALKQDTSGLDAKKRDKMMSKKLKDNDLTLILMDSYNRDSLKNTPFVESFMAYERSLTHGKSAKELIDIRIGQWVFLYVVLQMLPLLVVDAPGLRWTKSVEYYLCEVPKSSPPWMPEHNAAKVHYRIAATGGVVTMPADAVEHGIEGVYKRSHCWVAASRWSGQDAMALMAQTGGPTAHPASAHPSEAQSRISSMSVPSMSGRSNHDSEGMGPHSGFAADGLLSVNGGAGMRPPSRGSFMPGLEALPMPPTLGDAGANRRQSVIDPTKSFDAILGNMDQPSSKKKGKK